MVLKGFSIPSELVRFSSDILIDNVKNSVHSVSHFNQLNRHLFSSAYIECSSWEVQGHAGLEPSLYAVCPWATRANNVCFIRQWSSGHKVTSCLNKKKNSGMKKKITISMRFVDTYWLTTCWLKITFRYVLEFFVSTNNYVQFKSVAGAEYETFSKTFCM